ncbi:MAG: HAD family hydrolase [Oscillospiraceae bacterium]|nr:HAD family hydrolase [Oscillospiraceae bacterium]
MKNFDVLLFDLDGTLTDSAEGIMNCAEHALNVMGIVEPDRNKLLRFIGPPLVDSFMDFYGLSREDAMKAVAAYRERYPVKGIFENRVYEGIPEALEMLKNGGKRLAVATSKPEVFALRILDYFDLAKYFEVVTGAELSGERNAKAEVIAECLKRLGNPDKETVLMIGDRKHDVEGAKLCGIASAGVKFGYAEENELENAGAEYVFDTPLMLAESVTAVG